MRKLINVTIAVFVGLVGGSLLPGLGAQAEDLATCYQCNATLGCYTAASGALYCDVSNGKCVLSGACGISGG